MDETLNQILLNLAEATLSLYPADATGAPILSSQLWTGAKAEGLKIRERWIKMETRPSGAPYPNKHPLVAQYDIEIDRVWTLALAELDGFQADWENYVLDIVWKDEDSPNWHRRTFYGVTISEDTLNSRSIDAGFTTEQDFDAQYFVVSNGKGSVPDLTSTLPYQVVYQAALDAPPIPIYSYNPTNGDFTAIGNPSSYATILYTAGAYALKFTGEASAILATTVNALAYRNPQPYENSNCYQQTQFKVYGGIFTTSPAALSYPRVTFYYGTVRVCTVASIAGGAPGLYDVQFTQDDPNPSVPTGAYGLYGNETLVATLAANGVNAKNFVIIS